MDAGELKDNFLNLFKFYCVIMKIKINKRVRVRKGWIPFWNVNENTIFFLLLPGPHPLKWKHKPKKPEHLILNVKNQYLFNQKSLTGTNQGRRRRKRCSQREKMRSNWNEMKIKEVNKKKKDKRLWATTLHKSKRNSSNKKQGSIWYYSWKML